MHLSPLLDPHDTEPSCVGPAHRAALARGLAVLAVFACLLMLTMVPRLIHHASVARTLAEFAAWNATNHAETRH